MSENGRLRQEKGVQRCIGKRTIAWRKKAVRWDLGGLDYHSIPSSPSSSAHWTSSSSFTECNPLKCGKCSYGLITTVSSFSDEGVSGGVDCWVRREWWVVHVPLRRIKARFDLGSLRSHSVKHCVAGHGGCKRGHNQADGIMFGLTRKTQVTLQARASQLEKAIRF